MEPITFASSIPTFYMKGEIRQDDNLITLKVPNNILTFIPLGCKTDTIPVNQISSVGSDFYLDFKNLVIGAIIALLGLSVLGHISSFGDFIMGIIFTAVGAAEVLNAFHVYLKIRNTSGETVGESYRQNKNSNIEGIPFIIFDKSKAEQIASELNKLVNQNVNDVNVRIQTEAQTDRLVSAIEKISK